ncbi:MAG: TPM domain-containing protein [Gemmatimonadota bacterium]
MPRPVFLATLLLLSSSSLALGQGGIDKLVPASPNPAGFIYDGGPVLSVSDLAGLNARITELQSSGRGDIGVAILRDIGDYPPYEIGTAIFRAWKIGRIDSIGSERRDLGALLLIVPKELAPDKKGQCFIATGRGAEGLITDAAAATICREDIIPHLKAKEYAAAVGAGIDAIAARFSAIPATEGSAKLVSDHPSRSPLIPIGGGLGFVALLSAGVVSWRKYRRRRPRQCPRGHGSMRLLDERADDAALSTGQSKEEALKSVDYDVWECPVCQERLVLRYKKWFTAYSQCQTCHFWTVKSKNKTLRAATTVSTGLVETTKDCQNCGWHNVSQHSTPMISTSSSGSSSGGGGSSGGGSSFGGSGGSSGGGGGSSY